MDKVKLLDAGFSTQLAKYVNEDIDGHPLWTARFLVSDKEKCITVHRDYIKAGADIIRTGSYQASLYGFKKHLGLTKQEATDIVKNSVEYAKKAIQLEESVMGKKKEICVVGSIGPYAVRFHDGSEYTGSYANNVTPSELEDWHRPNIEALISGGADMLAFETIPCKKEAVTLAKLIKDYPQTRAWISFSTKDSSNISSGENFVDAATSCWSIAPQQLIAIGVNCIPPSSVVPLLSKLMKADSSIPLLASPNSGEVYDNSKSRWTKNKETQSISSYVEEWLNLGVSYIGGCCRTNADDTQQMSKEMKRWKNKIL